VPVYQDAIADDDEIARTRKIRRRFVAEKYAAVVEAFYGAAGEVEVSALITYDDGRRAILGSTIAICDLEEVPARAAAWMSPGYPLCTTISKITIFDPASIPGEGSSIFLINNCFSGAPFKIGSVAL
jgi:hypothetical protein